VHEFFTGIGIRYTFFVRCDNQIRDLYGSPLALYYEHQRLWDELRAARNEFAWHPHLYERRGEAYFPLRSPAASVRILQETWRDLSRLPFPVVSVRLGEVWHCNEAMRALDSLGLHVDSTALPGRARNDGLRCFDWTPTPNRPYHPSSLDYRVPDRENALGILEVPITTSPIRTEYDLKGPVPRYLNPVFHPELFRAGLDGYLSELQPNRDYDLVLIFHPDELTPRTPNGLYSYDWKHFTRNVEFLVASIGRHGHDCRFCCLEEARLERT
jgi:hypothetical protein